MLSTPSFFWYFTSVFISDFATVCTCTLHLLTFLISALNSRKLLISFWKISVKLLLELMTMSTPTDVYLSDAVVIYRTSSNFLLLHSFLFIKIFFSAFFSSFLLLLFFWKGDWSSYVFKKVLPNMAGESWKGIPDFGAYVCVGVCLSVCLSVCMYACILFGIYNTENIQFS